MYINSCQLNLIPKLQQRIDAFVQIKDESLRNTSLGLIQQLRQAGITTEYPLLKTKPDKQYKRALELNAKWLVTIESNNQAALKNIETREEQIYSLDKVIGIVESNI